MSITIILTLPPKELSPNSRTHWGAKSRAVKKARWSAWVHATAHAYPDAPKWRAATVQPTFYVKDKRGTKRDGDNCNASLKPYLDGLADAGIVENDRCFTLLPPHIEIDPETPRLQLVITEIAP